MEQLATYRACAERVAQRWPDFIAKRGERMRQQERFGACEKVAEEILADLFTEVLDWSLGDLNHQVGYADLMLTNKGIKWLIIEAKRPGALAWNRRAVESALVQALGYAHEQQVRHVAVSDGVMLYAADVITGGSRDRVYMRLDGQAPVDELWWLSLHGIYRPRQFTGGSVCILPEESPPAGAPVVVPASVLHPKYGLPADCFAYVKDANNPRTWKLPYRLANGSVDSKRLPKAIQCILTNYRGAQVDGIPEGSIPMVLRILATAAQEVGKMPSQTAHPSAVYQELENALKQFAEL